MALTISPYAHRISASPLSVTPSSPTPYPIMSRSVSINMEGMPDYGNDPENVEGLDMDMVQDFGEGMVNFGGPSEAKVPVGECLRRTLSCLPIMLTLATQIPLDS